METDGLYKIAEKHNVKIVEMEIHGKIEAFSISVGENSIICIDRKKVKDTADEKYKLAHELGHHISKAFYECENDTVYKYKLEYDKERQADEYAISLLIPFDEFENILKTDNKELWQIAEFFDVPQDLVKKAFWVYYNKVY